MKPIWLIIRMFFSKVWWVMKIHGRRCLQVNLIFWCFLKSKMRMKGIKGTTKNRKWRDCWLPNNIWLSCREETNITVISRARYQRATWVSRCQTTCMRHCRVILSSGWHQRDIQRTWTIWWRCWIGDESIEW